MKQEKITEPVKGYFVILGDERNSLKRKSSLDAGRTGIFYKKEDLVTTIQSNEVLKKLPMDVVEIVVPTHYITYQNCMKFSIKGGKEVKIINIQPFKEAVKEMMIEIT